LAGICSVWASPFPDLCVELWNLVEQSQYEEAFQRQLQINEIVAVIERYAAIHGRGTLAEVFRMRDIHIAKYPRWPTQELDEKVIGQLREELERLGAFAHSAALFQEPLPTEPPGPVLEGEIVEMTEAIGEEVDQTA
jgi:dihydrodipicolinate synthase/N-acetylneuraminate lyase